jgi:anti-sigma regulatory factor (Ser/Thr protein kinase)
MGLPNIKKYSDELDIETEPGKGTTLRALIYLDGSGGE